MRKLFAGVAVSVGLFVAVTLAQNPPNTTPGTQPGAAGQKQGEPAGQGQFPQGQAQAIPGQPAQPARVGQPAVVTQPGAVTQPRAVTQPGVVTQPGAVVQPGQPGRFTDTARAQGQSGSADQQVAACVHGECNNEIEIAKWAESKCTNDECREFAQRMVRDHTPGCQEMQRLAGDLATHGQGQQGRAAHSTTSGGQLDWIAIKHQIGEQCLASVKKELGSKQGADFDKCFMGQQISAHMKVIDELKVLRNHVSSDLQQKLDKELQGAEQHLQLAKQIEQKLKENPSERVTRRPEGSK